MRFPTLCAAVLCLPVLLVAQEGDRQQRSPGEVACAQLTAELQKQNRESRAARKAVTESAAYQAAAKAKDRAAMTELLAGVKAPDLAALGKQALVRAGELQGDDRVRVLAWAATKSRDPELVKQVVAEVRRDHLKSAALVDLLEQALAVAGPLGAQDGAKFLTEVVAASPHAQVRAWAMYWQAVMVQRDKKASDEAKVAAEKLLADAEQLAAGSELADRIAGPRFIEERLQIGMEAPNIVGEDVDGVPFQLSDYRGKVVVLDFWGFW